mgnify:CR=1 FL=1
MLRKKLSLILAATTLSFGLVACDGDDGDGDTGASASGTSGGESDSDESDSDESESESETNESESESETSNETDDTSDDSTTDDSAGDDTTGDDTSSDPCEGVMCADGEECVGGICVESDETDSGGGESDPSYPNPADGCPAGTLNGNDAAGMNICIPACDPNGADIVAACPQPATGTAPGLCILGDGSGSGDACDMNGAACEGKSEFCLGDPMTMENSCTAALACIISCQQGLVCPDGMTCNAQQVCEY